MTTLSEPPRAFDHTSVVGLSEYHDLRRAIDALGRHFDHEDAETVSRAGFVELIADMARTSYAADNCDMCSAPCWPIRAEVAAGWMQGTYWCPSCKRTWRCGYSTAMQIDGATS
jgi:hypothetical protein